jgi:nucleotide-binding universal stress UspA family protein
LNGLHILPARLKKSQAAQAIQEKFDKVCSEAGIPGKLTLSPGPVARKIVERSRWNDLVVVNLAYPPSPQSFSKLGSGFRELVLRCPRPILAVPGKTSSLSRPILAYDGSPKSEEALYLVTYLCVKWSLPLQVVSVIEKQETIEEIQNRAKAYLTSHGVTHQLFVREGAIAPAILITAEETDSDWIVMGGYGEPPLVNLLLDTVVDQVLRSSQKPMLLCR